MSDVPLDTHSVAQSVATPPPILFQRIDDPFGFMSNFSPHSVTADGVVYPTSEHYFQAMKFAHTPAVMEEIRLMKSPMNAATAGRSRDRPMRNDWDDVKDIVMEAVLLLKFSQHSDLREQLLATHGVQLVEHTTRDHYWGDGGDKGTGTLGKNRLGELLADTREYFASSEARNDENVNAKIEALMVRIRCAPTDAAPPAT
jgi:N-glycosidase YbiA